MELKNSSITQLVTFRLGRELYGIDIFKIQEVIHFQEVTTIPGAPAFMEGLIKLREVVIPVVDLKKRLGISGDSQARRRIIILDLEEMLVGVIVDELSKVLLLSGKSFESLPEAVVADENKDCIAGLVKTGDELIIVIAPEKILTARERHSLASFEPETDGGHGHVRPAQ